MRAGAGGGDGWAVVCVCVEGGSSTERVLRKRGIEEGTQIGMGRRREECRAEQGHGFGRRPAGLELTDVLSVDEAEHLLEAPGLSAAQAQNP